MWDVFLYFIFSLFLLLLARNGIDVGRELVLSLSNCRSGMIVRTIELAGANAAQIRCFTQ